MNDLEWVVLASNSGAKGKNFFDFDANLNLKSRIEN